MRKEVLPYGRPSLDQSDLEAIEPVLKTDWLTTGPKVSEFERAFADFVGAKEAVAVCNGTAALHCAANALGIGPGDEVIVPAMTFAASANCVVYQGGTPIFADVDSETLLVDPADVERKVTARTKALVAVDYAGQACDYDALSDIARSHNLKIVDDACHAVGGFYKGRPVGTLADLNTFSFHPVKHFTTGEGGMITTDDEDYANHMRIFRNHGITSDHRQRSEQGSFFYEMVDLGFNYRLTDFQCALGINQLPRVPDFVQRRQQIAALYDRAFADMPAVRPLSVRPDVSHAYHLYMVQFDIDRLNVDRATIFSALRAEGIGVNVHYIPVHLHPFYRQHYGLGPGLCPVAEAAYERLVTLPMFPAMTSEDVANVVTAVEKVVSFYGEKPNA
ncbi:MAG TPA: UDP-4-amino-4,6-dideoxy-N-acetyl-beta-L-altrosamine transaminase [Pyrinomonadaceae bacterium]|nr:UDP-4-amino-4,6-dideoxy-N-acetyl-beta-L-altrosamine transaminase [Pyrinomonadaceae bacterium]